MGDVDIADSAAHQRCTDRSSSTLDKASDQNRRQILSTAIRF